MSALTVEIPNNDEEFDEISYSPPISYESRELINRFKHKSKFIFESNSKEENYINIYFLIENKYLSNIIQEYLKEYAFLDELKARTVGLFQALKYFGSLKGFKISIQHKFNWDDWEFIR